MAAAAQNMLTSAYIARVPDQPYLLGDMVAEASDGAARSEMIRRAAAVRAEPEASFPEDPADLIGEARERRHASR